MKVRGIEGRPTAGYRIRLWLESQDRSQIWLAERVGIKSSHLSMILRGQRGPSLLVARRLEEITGVKAIDFAVEARP